MAYIYSKGWFVQQLKAANISKIDGRKLESYKTYILRNLYAELIDQSKING
ncbi:YflJ family protein [Priestia megaterium]|uniref:YflJ family protein n=1 Tax=Priestia megaterium TaxID=1404 RepID=UPI00317C2DED